MMATSAGFAQQVSGRAERVVSVKEIANKGMMVQQQFAADNSAKAKGPRRAAADGFYQTKPAGSLYRNFDRGYGYYAAFVLVSPYDDIVFNDMSSSSATNKWYLYGSNGGYDMTENKDADNNLNLGYLTPGYQYPGTVLKSEDGTKADSLGINNLYGSYATYPIYVIPDSIGTLGFLDDHTGAYGWGGLDNAYLFGSGTRTYSGGTVATCYAVYQEYPKPMSPLYVENAECLIFCDSATHLAAGVELTMTIYNSETEEVIATLTATSDDVVDFERYGNHSGYKTGEYYGGYLVFANKQKDAFGAEYNAPFTIDCPTTVVIDGLQQDGVNVCFTGVEIQDADLNDFAETEETEEGETTSYKQGFQMVYYTNSEGETKTTGFGYKSPIAVNITFRGVMDKIVVPDVLYSYDDDGNVEATYEGCNVLKAPTEGGTATVESTESEYVLVETVFFFKQKTAYEMYYTQDELPDWLEMEANPYYATTSNGYTYYSGTTYLTFVAEALPDGVTGRSAQVTIEGRGATADKVIEVLQGDAVSGISVVEKANTASNHALYNLNGQRVNKNAKGVLVRDGKKFISK